MNSIEWWLDRMNMDDAERKFLNTVRGSNIYLDDGIFGTLGIDDIQDMFRNDIFMNDIGDMKMQCSDCATNIIDKLFEMNVDDETLVITSGSEHPSVVKNLEKCKNVVAVTQYDRFNQNIGLFQMMKPFKKVFIYMIGLSVGNNYFTPQDFFIQIKDFCIKRGLEFKIAVDAVQEMFLLPRDYTLFDYVIGTAHAMIPKFNMGILLSRENIFGFDMKLMYQYYHLLRDHILREDRREYIYMFHYVMNQYFGKRIANDKALSVNSNSPYIFNLTDKKNRLEGIQEIQGRKPESSIVTFRACNDIINIDTFMSKIKQIERRLDVDF